MKNPLSSAITLLSCLATFAAIIHPSQVQAQSRGNAVPHQRAIDTTKDSQDHSHLTLSDWNNNEKISIRIFYKNGTFEKIFYDNFAKEIEIEKQKQKNISGSSASEQEFNLIKFATNLASSQISEAIEIGIVDISILSLESYYVDQAEDNIGYLDYPFMFANNNQVQTKYFSTSSLIYPNLNSLSPQAIPVAVMPYAYRIFASQKKDLKPKDIINEPLTIENNQVLKNTYKFFKKPESLLYFSANEPKTQTIETTALDLYDKQYFKNYKYVYLTNHSLKSSVLVVGKKWWSALNAPQREIIVQSLSKAVQKTLDEVTNFNSVVLGSLENQNNIVVRKVDMQGEYRSLKDSLTQIHYDAIKSQKILPFYKSIQPK